MTMMRAGWLARAVGGVLALGALHCELFEGSERALLAECTFNDECTSPLLCAARQCRAPCRTDRDCTNGWRCLSAGQYDKYVCYQPDVVANACNFDSDCRHSRVCSNHVCSQQCRSDFDCRLVDIRATCLTNLGVCSNHPHLTDAGTLLDVERNDDPDASAGP